MHLRKVSLEISSVSNTQYGISTGGTRNDGSIALRLLTLLTGQGKPNCECHYLLLVCMLVVSVELKEDEVFHQNFIDEGGKRKG